MTTKKIIKSEEAFEIIKNQADDFGVVKNPEFIHPELEIYPLAYKITKPINELNAVLMDLDGTITMTEDLALHSLEYVMRSMSGRKNNQEWAGLDKAIDYPNVIGNSTTKHVEFLINRYSNFLLKDEFLKSYFNAVVWSLKFEKDPNRLEELKDNLKKLNIADILDDEKLNETLNALSPCQENQSALNDYFYKKFAPRFTVLDRNDLVVIGIDIYYYRYHDLLERIRTGGSEELAEELFKETGKLLISPMPGAAIFLAFIKGWIGEEIVSLIPELLNAYEIKSGFKFHQVNPDQIHHNLIKVSSKIEESPLKIGIATSSILYETDIVLQEIFKIFSTQISEMNLSEGKRSFLKNKFEDYRTFFDLIVTANDSSEIRLKPHRDLYSLALHRLGIPVNKFNGVLGLEDSESGIIALRGAGIGLCAAVPYAQTRGHNFDAASYVVKGGLPEILLKYNLFLNISADQ